MRTRKIRQLQRIIDRLDRWIIADVESPQPQDFELNTLLLDAKSILQQVEFVLARQQAFAKRQRTGKFPTRQEMHARLKRKPLLDVVNTDKMWGNPKLAWEPEKTK